MANVRSVSVGWVDPGLDPGATQHTISARSAWARRCTARVAKAESLARAFAHPTRLGPRRPLHDVKQPCSFPRRVAPGVCNLSFIHPEGWRSAETALGCSGTRSVPKR